MPRFDPTDPDSFFEDREELIHAEEIEDSDSDEEGISAEDTGAAQTENGASTAGSEVGAIKSPEQSVCGRCATVDPQDCVVFRIQHQQFLCDECGEWYDNIGYC